MKKFRYGVQITGDAPESAVRFGNKKNAIALAREMAKDGSDVSIYDYNHPDLRGIEYARRIWRSAVRGQALSRPGERSGEGEKHGDA